tara:strand:+ start:1319 stop:1564 length:246 start_codon:yes stop_codon:yes gene_type:complete
MISKRELERIVNNSRRDALMREYVELNGGSFERVRGRWVYNEEVVVDNRIEKQERRESKKETKVKAKKKAKEKKSFLKLRK